MNQQQQINPDAIGVYLESQAKLGKLVTYGQLVNQFGLPPLDGAWVAHPLSSIFEVIDQQDAAAKRPFRTSIVVSSGTKTPGGGFFEALQRLKGIQEPRTKKARDDLWIAEVNATHKYRWP